MLFAGNKIWKQTDDAFLLLEFLQRTETAVATARGAAGVDRATYWEPGRSGGSFVVPVFAAFIMVTLITTWLNTVKAE